MNISEYKMSLYNGMKDKNNKTITFEDYIGMVKHATYQDLVIKARIQKQKGDQESYKAVKNQAPVVTIRGTFQDGDAKTEKNITPNGLIEIDVDEILSEEQLHLLTNDPYVLALHKSIGGDGHVIFFRVDPNKISDAYYSIAEYLKSKYDINSDPSGKNVNRLRFVSWDSDIFVNEKAKKFTVRIEKKNKLPQNLVFLHTKDSIDFILEQIDERNIDLCQESYERYVRIGCSIASEYGDSGEAYFHAICSKGSKYREQDANRDWKGFLRSTDKISIGTLYYYAKEEGISIYTPKTKELINRVKIGKSQGNPTVESVKQNMEALGYEIDSEDEKIIGELLVSKSDYSKLANEELSEIEQLAKFIVDVYNPTRDEINKNVYLNSKEMQEIDFNDVYLKAKANFDFKVNVQDVKSIISSSYTKGFNALSDFLKENEGISGRGCIDAVVDCIETDMDREYVKWAFTKWLVSGLHNWTCSEADPIVSPLALILCSDRMGSGKTYFFRTLLPENLQLYFIEGKLDINHKDSRLRLPKCLLLLDDEFGGKSVKDAEQFKAMSDINKITDRPPYAMKDSTFKRRALLCGTSNKYNLLKDFTGKQRRILPINITNINHEMFQKVDKVGLIMEAYNLLISGYDWKIFTEKDVDYLYQNTQENIDTLPLEDIFLTTYTFNYEPGMVEYVMNQGEVSQWFQLTHNLKLNKHEISDIFSKNFIKYQSHKTANGNKKGYKFWSAM